MNEEQTVRENSDSLIDLLTSQCADLEKLLALAREETSAAQQGKFFKILDIVSERTEITKKLETFQQQIAELRGCLASTAQSAVQATASDRIVELASMTLAQDQKTRLLLTASREESAASIRNLEKSNSGANAYLQNERKGLAYSRNI